MKTQISSDKKHLEDLNKTIENLRKLPHNKQCFDCGEKVNKLNNLGNNLCCFRFRNIYLLELFWNSQRVEF